MEALELLDSCQASSLGVVGRVAPEDRHRATPCAGWQVDTLLDKMVTSARLFATFCRGEQPGPDLNLLEPKPLAGDQPSVVYAEAIAECADAFRSSQLEGEMMGPLGVLVPRRAGLMVRSIDCTLNTWDLARSIGVEPSIDPAVPDALLEFATGFLAKVRERDDWVRFAEPIEVESSGLDALVAVSGRDPAWTP